MGNKIDENSVIQNVELIDEQLNEYDIKRVSFLYALAKDKSNFESSLISKDFKIGMMQLKPSYVESISQALNQPYSLTNQFDSNESIKYANLHLNSLENRFKNIFMLSVAYDGKIKQLNKNIENNIIKTPNIFEPFLSLELVLNKEFEDKKEFLLDYVLYYNLLTKKEKDELSLLSIYQNLLVPDQIVGE